jgi:hypothetical protein
MNEKAECSNCRFHMMEYRPLLTLGGMDMTQYFSVSSCHILSPNINGWPTVKSTDWCGEHEPMEEKK